MCSVHPAKIINKIVSPKLTKQLVIYIKFPMNGL